MHYQLRAYFAPEVSQIILASSKWSELDGVCARAWIIQTGLKLKRLEAGDFEGFRIYIITEEPGEVGIIHHDAGVQSNTTCYKSTARNTMGSLSQDA
ncbi:hypothetical protein KOW79_016350 [Hemibagrus wyckioides]|uniref:Uncharacterized protein n=1 Tax=Hemibagrus wyckioides TaxID=337641 RepID=A0A9D3SDT7_9TELE|nr:hypothetical protein KOW79_016350 [Hemibagrus wyckioides]